jgi:hypothetical protein
MLLSSFGGSVKLTGESEYRKALSEISSNLKVLNSEMKTVTSQYDKNDKSVGNLSSQNNVLNKKIEEQEKKVNLLKNALADSQKETGENSEKTKKWQIELNNAQADLNKLNREVKENADLIGKAEKETDELADETQKVTTYAGLGAVALKLFGDVMKGLGDETEEAGEEEDKTAEKTLKLGDIIKANLISDAITGGLSALGDAIGGIGAKFGELLSLGEETKEMQTSMAKLNASFESAGLGAENANKAMTDLQGVLGDTGKATEASVLLSKMSKDGKDLEANTRILTGVFAEYGDAIPTEGLAEAMSATSAMGSVQGVLADALEWQGVNLDEYNEKLASMTSAEERASYIQSTLTDIYGASADAYRENNEALIESNEAALRNEQTMARLGQTTLPISTNLTNMKSTLLEGLTPALSVAMEGVSGITGAFNGLLTAIISGDEGGIEEAMTMISEQVSAMVENVSAIMPGLIDVASRIISTLIGVIAQNLPTILTEGVKLLKSLLDGISQSMGQIFPVVLEVVQTLLTTILQNLPMLIDMGCKMLVSLIQGIAQMLPELIPTIIDAVILMVETLLDNIDLIIDAGIELIMALADGLIDALPKLIEKIPVIIDKLITAITNNLPKIIEMGIELTLQLAVGIIKAIPQLVEKLPQIITSMVKGLKDGIGKIGEVGKNLVSGLWEGISGSIDWIKNKIKGWVGDVTKFLKKLFGINSPSRVFKEEIGTNLALGVGEGFADTMSEVSKEMGEAIPTEFDADISTSMSGASAASQMSTYDMMVSAFEQALTKVKVVMDDREMGGFVVNHIERAVFA